MRNDGQRLLWKRPLGPFSVSEVNLCTTKGKQVSWAARIRAGDGVYGGILVIGFIPTSQPAGEAEAGVFG